MKVFLEVDSAKKSADEKKKRQNYQACNEVILFLHSLWMQLRLKTV